MVRGAVRCLFSTSTALFTTVVGGLFSAIPNAKAQTCHEPLALEGERLTLETRVSAARLSGGGTVFGFTPAVAARLGRFHGGARLPLWTLDRPGLTQTGPGDLTLRAGAQLLSAPAGDVDLDLGASLPSGDAGAGLGMGHVMLTPGLSLTTSFGHVTGLLRVLYARTLGHHHDHGGTATPFAPIVDPMNAAEIALGAGADAHIDGPLSLGLGALWAEPAGLPGRRRIAAVAGVRLDLAPFVVGIEAEAAIRGDAHGGKGGAFLRWRP